MKKIFLFILFIGSNTFSYDGPRSAGVEDYTPGEYRIKGYLNCISGESCTLQPYYKTTREYKIKLRGPILKKFKFKPGYYEFYGHVFEKKNGDRMPFFVLSYPRTITSLNALKNTVKKIK